jgi:dynein heavy chain, axonemal
MQVEGARWDPSGSLEESEPKKQFSIIPVVNCKAQEVGKGKGDDKNTYHCPVYLTPTRGKSYVFPAQLKTKQPPNKWILAGVAIILDVEGFSDPFSWGKNPNE